MRTQIALAVSFVLAGPMTFFTAHASPSFEQDVIVVPENATDFENEQMFVYGEWSYQDNVLGTPNTMVPPEGGLRGILYDRGLSCSADVTDALPLPSQFHDLPKIALIKRGQCFFSQKLLYAQMDGAIAAIVYDNMTFAEDPVSQYGMTIPPDTINITAFYVDQSVGEELYQRLKNITQFNLAQQPGNTGIEGDQPGIHFARVTMFSGETSSSSAWQYTLITIGVILIASICTSVILHCHIWRRRYEIERQRQERAIIPLSMTNSEPVNCRQMLEPSLLDMFPTRIAGQDAKCSVYKEMIGRNAISLTDLRDTVLFYPASKADQPRARSLLDKPLENGIEMVEIEHNEQQNSLRKQDCVICLDSIDKGDILRVLTCGHEYHRDCIDPWLTKRSASCPLCKKDMLSGMEVPEPVHYADQGRPRAYSNDSSLTEEMGHIWERISENFYSSVRRSRGGHDNSVEMVTRSNDTA